MPRIKSDKFVVWAAVNPEGKIVVSSVSAYHSVAQRWAAKYRQHEVKQLCVIDRHMVETKAERERDSAPIKIPAKVAASVKNGVRKNNVQTPYQRRKVSQ